MGTSPAQCCVAVPYPRGFGGGFPTSHTEHHEEWETHTPGREAEAGRPVQLAPRLWKDVAGSTHLFNNTHAGARSGPAQALGSHQHTKQPTPGSPRSLHLDAEERGGMRCPPEVLPGKTSTWSWGTGNSRPPPAEGFWVVSCFSPTARGNSFSPL